MFGDEETLEEEVEHFMDDEENFFGRKDDDIQPFSGLFSQFGQMMNSLPQVEIKSLVFRKVLVSCFLTNRLN